MAWDIDELIWMSVRDKILKDRYAGCEYSMLDSFSPIIIRHREPLPLKDRHKIQKLFPKWIRIEFQEVHYEGERVALNGRGNLIIGDQYNPLDIKEYVKGDKGWITTKFTERGKE